MSWQRPVPLVGDTSSARARRDAPRAWALGEQDRDAFYAAVLGRRDIRRFRPDDLEPDVLERILGAAMPRRRWGTRSRGASWSCATPPPATGPR